MTTAAETRRVPFTMQGLALAECEPGKSRSYYYDPKTPGLALCVTDRDARSFYVYRRVKGRPVRYRLGGFPELTVTDARNLAADVLGRIARGSDPQAERKQARADSTFGELAERYLKEHVRPKRSARTASEYEAQRKLYLAEFEKRRLSSITRADVARLHAKLGKDRPVTANRVLALISAIFNYAEGVGFEGVNPARRVEKFPEQERERYLLPSEMPQFWAALKATPDEMWQDFFALLLYTGARRRSVGAMAWADVSLPERTWRIPRTKSGKPQTIPLPAEALEILKRRRKAAGKKAVWVFPSYGKSGHIEECKAAWADLMKRAKLKDLTPHDLRRTCGSWLAAAGVSEIVIAKTLGHVSTAATKRYTRTDLTPIREALGGVSAAMTAAAMTPVAKPKRKGRAG